MSAQSLCCVLLFATLWTVAHLAPLSMEFSRQEYWSGLPFLSPGDLPDPGIKPGSSTLQAESLLSESSGKPQFGLYIFIKSFVTHWHQSCPASVIRNFFIVSFRAKTDLSVTTVTS